jgi:hypothetical protein
MPIIKESKAVAFWLVFGWFLDGFFTIFLCPILADFVLQAFILS